MSGSSTKDESPCNHTTPKPAPTEEICYFTVAEIAELKRLLVPLLNKIQAFQGNPPVIVPGRKRTHS